MNNINATTAAAVAAAAAASEVNCYSGLKSEERIAIGSVVSVRPFVVRLTHTTRNYSE